ncbi:hypothetical protein E4U55_006715 [Claviceps digitariae]|nr:hypothetical protein E4U55_006715 [Claviceps digitariae]
MASPPETAKTSKRPRLSLQIHSACNPPSQGLRGQPMDPSDPTTFNTMSNIYVGALERFPAKAPESITATDALPNSCLKTPVEKANSDSDSESDSRPAVVKPLFVQTCPDTPLTAQRQPTSAQHGNLVYPSTITATSPLSAGARDNASNIFTFSLADTSSPRSCPSIRSPVGDDGGPFRLRGSLSSSEMPAGSMPYTHPRSLHSILRNSPLPTRPVISPPPSSPRRQLLRLQEKAAKKVEYDSPLEEEITTYTYTKSHNDLLAEDGSPLSPSDCALSAAAEQPIILDMGLSFTANEIQDGGQTPGPFEDMRRKMAGLTGDDNHANRKRKRLEKKRQWVWTIGLEEDDEDVGDAIASFRAQTAADKTVDRVDFEATPSIESSSSPTDVSDGEMSDLCSIVSSEDHHPRRYHSLSSDGGVDADAKTCTLTAVEGDPRRRNMPISGIGKRINDLDTRSRVTL